MTAIVKSLPIPWSNLPGSAKDRLTHDVLLLAQDSAAIQDAYYLDIYAGMNPSKLSQEYTKVSYGTDIFKFRNTVERLIRQRAREVRKGFNKTNLSDWFSKVATTLHRAIKQDSELRLVHVRNNLAELLFNVKGSDVKVYFIANPNSDTVDRKLLLTYLLEQGLDKDVSVALVDELDDISVDTNSLDERSKQAYLDRANILGLYPIREFLSEEQVLLITLVGYGLGANMVHQYNIGKYALITLATHIIYNVGYREFKLYVLAEKVNELQQRPLDQIIEILRKKHVPKFYIDELNRFFN